MRAYLYIDWEGPESTGDEKKCCENVTFTLQGGYPRSLPVTLYMKIRFLITGSGLTCNCKPHFQNSRSTARQFTCDPAILS
jgi:hypothetical protein